MDSQFNGHPVPASLVAVLVRLERLEASVWLQNQRLADMEQRLNRPAGPPGPDWETIGKLVGAALLLAAAAHGVVPWSEAISKAAGLG